MTWWCAATGLPWTGQWRAYPGVWLFLIAVLGSYWQWGRPPAADRSRATGYYLFGVGLLWGALDWPLGALGGYLAAAHTGQYILLALAAPPFLLLGLAPRLASDRKAPRRWLKFLAHPLPAFAGYNIIMLATHAPGVVDRLMTSQLGSLAIDLGWILSGLFLWWPVTAPASYRRLSPPLQMGYLFVQTIPATLPAAALVFASYPLYRLYELAPRVTPALDPGNDHQLAGLLMKVVGDPVVWIGIAIIFFKWANHERRADLERAVATAPVSID
jgi:putative membrane protein